MGNPQGIGQHLQPRRVCWVYVCVCVHACVRVLGGGSAWVQGECVGYNAAGAETRKGLRAHQSCGRGELGE